MPKPPADAPVPSHGRALIRERLLVLLGSHISTRGTGSGLETRHFLTGGRAPARRGPVSLFMEGAPLPARYEELGLVQVVASGDANVARLLPALQDEAASLGADAVILVRIDHGGGRASATGVAVRGAVRREAG